MLQRKVIDLFAGIKSGKNNRDAAYKLPVSDAAGKLIAHLRPITENTLDNDKEIALLAKWRRENSFAFPSQFKVTQEGTKTWLQNQLIKNPTRILFFVESAESKPKLIGHLGLYSFDFKTSSCEIDNVVRGEKNYLKGVMSLALKTLINWTKKELKPKNILLRVFSDNAAAINYYKRCGFKDYKLLPLRKTEKPNMIIWEEDITLKRAEKYFLQMILSS